MADPACRITSSPIYPNTVRLTINHEGEILSTEGTLPLFGSKLADLVGEKALDFISETNLHCLGEMDRTIEVQHPTAKGKFKPVIVRLISETTQTLTLQIECLGPIPLTPDPKPLDPLPTLRVLVIDDSLVNSKLLGTVLKKLDQDVAIANSGEHALEKLASSTALPHLIICDFNMTKEMNGFQFFTALQEDTRYKDIFRVLWTDDNDAKAENDWGAVGVHYSLDKPCRDSDLLRSAIKICAEAVGLSSLERSPRIEEEPA